MEDRIPSQVHKELGQRLRQLRTGLGLRQSDLAQRARITQPRVSQIERGEIKDGLPERTLIDLADALGVSPASLVGDDPSLRSAESAAAAREGRSASGLPPLVDTLVGRDEDLAAVARKLAVEKAQLLTLTGSGGVGKTQLALRALADLAGSFVETTAVSLASCTDTGQVVAALAYALGIKEREARPLRERLLASLRASHRLVLLDNVEQTLPSVADLVADMLAACPALTLLVTSRAPLRITGEHEYPVFPLALPERTRAATVDTVAASPAVQLFLRRARAVSPGLSLSPDTAPVIAEIVHRLDGLPLAIELAAARAKAFPPAAMLRRLDARLSFLTIGPRDLPARQRTLRAAIGWSHDLLDEDERTLFRRLAVFPDGFTADTVDAIARPTDQPRPAEILLDQAAELLDWGMLTRSDQPDGAVRYGMLETVREFAWERLEAAGETAELSRLHLTWCLTFVEEATARLFSAEEDAWLARLQQEDATLQAALGWAFRQQGAADVELGFLLAGALADYWYVSGRLTEGRGWLARAETLGAGLAPSLGRARSLVGACQIEQTQSAVEPAELHGEEALHLATLLDDQPTIGRAMLFLGNLAMMQGDLARASLLHEEAYACFERLGNRAWSALALLNLGMDFFRQGQLDEAARCAEDALKMTRAIGDRWDTIATLRLLGDVACERGDLELAKALYAESLGLSWQHGSDREVADSLSGMGALALVSGDLVRAARLLGAAETLYQRSEITLPPPLRPDWNEVVARVRDGLGMNHFREAWLAASPEQVTLEIIGLRRFDDQGPVTQARRMPASRRDGRSPDGRTSRPGRYQG